MKYLYGGKFKPDIAERQNVVLILVIDTSYTNTTHTRTTVVLAEVVDLVFFLLISIHYNLSKALFWQCYNICLKHLSPDNQTFVIVFGGVVLNIKFVYKTDFK